MSAKMGTQFVEKIVHEVKSQGVFDEFRKDSMADVDTKPAYQNLRQRVETTVKKFLAKQKWSPETNKNQLREKLRRHISESGFLDVGVERIVDQVVNPKVCSVFQPRIEEIAYKYLGVPPPPKKFEPPPPPLMHPLPPLPIAPPPLKVETCSLLPNDLEQVSPDSDKATVQSGIEGEDKTEYDMETNDKIYDEDESPPFEPLVTKEDNQKIKSEICAVKAEHEDSSLSGNFKKEQPETGFNIKLDVKDEVESQDSNIISSKREYKEASQSMDCRVFQDSQLSSVSSDTRLSPETKVDSPLLRSSQEEAATANISEEAQMPKFSENSNEPSTINDCKNKQESELHFDIKKDEIRFEGTERKTNMENNSLGSSPPVDMKCSPAAEKYSRENDKEEFKFEADNVSRIGNHEDDEDRTPIADELSFGSSMENSPSISPDNGIKKTTNYKEKFMSIELKSPRPTTPTLPQTTTALMHTPIHTPTITPAATPTPPSTFTQTNTPTTPPVSSQKSERDHQSSRHSSSSSSSKNKKHYKESRRSDEQERDKDRYRSGRSKDSKYHSSSMGKTCSSKHSSLSNKNSSSNTSHNKSSSDRDKYKDLKKSSSKYSKHSSEEKRSHSKSNAHRDQSSSSSTTSTKRNERKDDHYETKHKIQRRKSTDSNDDNEKGSGGGAEKNSSRRSHKGRNTTSSRSKSNTSKEAHESSNNNKEAHNDHLTMQPVHNGIAQNKGNVIILNNLLENPQTQFIELDTRGHSIGTPQSSMRDNTTNSSNLNYFEDPSTSTSVEKNSDLLYGSTDLLYFEDIKSSLMDRFDLLNETMDLCRSSANIMLIDLPIDEDIEVSNEIGFNRCTSGSLNFLSETLKRKSNSNYEEFEKTPRKRVMDNIEECQLKTSPLLSDSSVNSKENEEIDKNTDDSVTNYREHGKSLVFRPQVNSS